ncbi:MAG: chromosome partitioning protein, ParB family [Pelagibacterales bacterium]|nr:chromosome partitioning protein, ParB family [Pelagibacterales bacterium]
MMIDNRLKKGLGRGLSSLLGDTSSQIEKNTLAINDLTPNKFQPRKNFAKEKLEELTNSIKQQGVIQPIAVRPIKNGKYEIIAGERRWLASQNAGLHEVPVIIIDIDDAKSLEFAIVENVQRQDLNAVEEAKSYQKLIDDFNYDQEKLSKFIGKSRSYIANLLRLLSLPEEVLLMLEKSIISAGHARSIIGLHNSLDIAKKIVAKKLSVRQAEILAKQFKNKKFKLIQKKDANILDLQKVLEEKTGLNVSISNKKNNSGIISFQYLDLDQLDKIIETIKNNY